MISRITMFNKAQTPETLMGPETNFEGKLHFNGRVRIEGVLAGEIKTDDQCIVGQKGRVHALMHVGTLISHGALRGDICVTDTIHLYPNSVVEGRLFAKNIITHPKAEIRADLYIGADAEERFLALDDKLSIKTNLPSLNPTLIEMVDEQNTKHESHEKNGNKREALGFIPTTSMHNDTQVSSRKSKGKNLKRHTRHSNRSRARA